VRTYVTNIININEYFHAINKTIEMTTKNTKKNTQKNKTKQLAIAEFDGSMI
jgi:hypothetical protein